MLSAISASLGLNASWQEAWSWFAATYPQARYPLAIGGVIAGLTVFVATVRRPMGRLLGCVAALLLIGAGVAPGPVVGALMSAIDGLLSMFVSFFS